MDFGTFAICVLKAQFVTQLHKSALLNVGVRQTYFVAHAFKFF